MATPIAQELTERISFILPTGPRDAATKTSKVNEVFATAWARITEGSGPIEAEDQQHEVQTQSFEVWTQYIDGVTGFMQIQWGARTLIMIEAPQKVIDQQFRSWLLVHANEFVERSL